MKKIGLIILLITVVCFINAQIKVTADTLNNLKEAHKKALQNFGYYYMWNEKNCSFAVVGDKLVSVIKGKFEYSYYTEYKGYKIYAHLNVTPGANSNEILFVFDCRITKNENTYQFKITYTFNFGNTPSFNVKVNTDSRWDWGNCLECLQCAADKINDLYKAYQECGLDWQCWLTKYQDLIDLYNCVVNHCISCFTSNK